MNKLSLTNAATVGAVHEIGPPFTVNLNFVPNSGPVNEPFPFYLGGSSAFLDRYNRLNNLFYKEAYYFENLLPLTFGTGFIGTQFKWANNSAGVVGNCLVFWQPGNIGYIDLNNMILCGKRFKIKYVNVSFNPQSLSTSDVFKKINNIFTFASNYDVPKFNRTSTQTLVGPLTPEYKFNNLTSINVPADVVIDCNNGFGIETINAVGGSRSKNYYDISLTLVEVK